MPANYHPRDFFNPRARALRLITDWYDARYDPDWTDSYDGERLDNGDRRRRPRPRHQRASPESVRRWRQERERRALFAAHLNPDGTTSILKDD